MPPDSGSGDPLGHDQRRARRPAAAARLTRGRERVLGGIASGIAAFVAADPRIVRWLFVVVTLLSLGLGSLVYLLLWFLLPDESGPGT